MTVIYSKIRHMHRRGYLWLAASGAFGYLCALSLNILVNHLPK
jgi:hypothetical protein